MRKIISGTASAHRSQRTSTSPLDTRPNKKLDPVMIEYLYRDYKYHDLIVDRAKHGFDPIFEHSEPRQRETIPNHKSAKSNIHAVEKF